MDCEAIATYNHNPYQHDQVVLPLRIPRGPLGYKKANLLRALLAKYVFLPKFYGDSYISSF